MSTLFLKPTERNKQDMESLGMFFYFFTVVNSVERAASQQILGQGSG